MSRSSRPVWLGEDKRGWDHVRIHVQLYKDRRLGANHITVYGGIAIHAETDSGEAEPAVGTLAVYADISERTCRKVLDELEGFEYISREPRSGKATIYRLLPPPHLPTPAAGTGVHQNSAGVDANAQVRGTPETASGVPPQQVRGSADEDPRTDFGGPPQQLPRTPAAVADELERERTSVPSEQATTVAGWTANDVFQKVIKPGESSTIPTAIRARIGAELKKLAADRYDFDIVCRATRRVIDENRVPTALPHIVMDILKGQERYVRGHQPFQDPEDHSVYAEPIP